MISVQKLDESESGQMVWEKWNEHILMFISPVFFHQHHLHTLYDAVSANVMISVQKLDESESGQMVWEKVKWAYSDVISLLSSSTSTTSTPSTLPHTSYTGYSLFHHEHMEIQYRPTTSTPYTLHAICNFIETHLSWVLEWKYSLHWSVWLLQSVRDG